MCASCSFSSLIVVLEYFFYDFLVNTFLLVADFTANDIVGGGERFWMIVPTFQWIHIDSYSAVLK